MDPDSNTNYLYPQHWMYTGNSANLFSLASFSSSVSRGPNRARVASASYIDHQNHYLLVPVMRIRLNYYMDPDPGSGNPPYKSGSKEKTSQNSIFQNFAEKTYRYLPK